MHPSLGRILVEGEEHFAISALNQTIRCHHGIVFLDDIQAVVEEVDVLFQDCEGLFIHDEAKLLRSNFLSGALIRLTQVVIQIFCDIGGGTDIVAVSSVEDSFQLGQL